jgi:ABC-type multidrug transport system ATPase subunit
MYCLIGPNGCGKTTLIKSILGMVLPNKGEIFFQKNPYLKYIEYRKKLAICHKLEGILKICLLGKF